MLYNCVSQFLNANQIMGISDTMCMGVRVCMCARACVCVYMCVSEREREREKTKAEKFNCWKQLLKSFLLKTKNKSFSICASSWKHFVMFYALKKIVLGMKVLPISKMLPAVGVRMQIKSQNIECCVFFFKVVRCTCKTGATKSSDIYVAIVGIFAVINQA